MKTKNVTFFFLLLLLCTGIAAAQANSQEKAPQPGWVFSVEDLEIKIESVQLLFLVRDADGNLVHNLRTSDFRLMENGEEKPITVFQQKDVPINACIVVDTSWSIGSMLDNVLKTASEFFSGLTHDKTSVVYFSEHPRVIADWNLGVNQGSPFKNVKLEGRTALYDSLLWIMNNHFKNISGKKLIFLITDGIDNMSRSSVQEMFQAAHDRGIVVYAIIYTNPVIENLRHRLLTGKISSSVSPALQKMIQAQNSFIDKSLRYGGRTIFSNSFGDMHSIYQRVIDETKSQYVLSFPTPKEEVSKRDIRFLIKPEVPGRIVVQISH
ncbi:MAG TPA: VWA domain-containing protein [Acidobacteriota bacterium]|jgi:VWFA-related protein